MTHAPGVYITGPARSGTSMTAGLFAKHGVFFGDCRPADDHNPYGYFEHPCLTTYKQKQRTEGWPEVWWATLEREGWTHGPWGAKKGAGSWPWVSQLKPTVVVFCVRPKEQIRASRARWGKGGSVPPRVRRALRAVEQKATCPIVAVNTPNLIAGDYTEVLPAFELLGVEFSVEIAREWIDPSVWCRGMKP